jgi:hypothetical protein
MPVVALLAMVNWPAKLPAVAGSNCTSMVTDCPGFNVTWKEHPDSVKPVPLIVTEFTVRGAVPVELSVTACSIGALR